MIKMNVTITTRKHYGVGSIDQKKLQSISQDSPLIDEPMSIKDRYSVDVKK